jgi:hypothetical protein
MGDRPSIDFRWIKREISPERAFHLLDIEMSPTKEENQWRGDCVACGAERTFVYTHGAGFICHTCDERGKADVIGLAAFAIDSGQWEGAFELAKRAGIPLKPSGTVHTTGTRTSTVRSTVPQGERGSGNRPEPRSPRRETGDVRPPPASSRQHSFDPTAFGAKLEYTEEVEALGITEDDAIALGIGFYRGKLYQALRYENGDVAGYSSFANGEFKLPPRLLPMTNIVPLRHRA